MLKITDYFQTKDVEANKIISSFISNRLLEMMENIQDDNISCYFPEKLQISDELTTRFISS